ncbi:hypothetical protein [Kitasatospora sp. DSM 101779]|uniref:hypothetical protein n=1 Tax=Kitasatospora sp. DSM 101779 TaxID=2853165 RepID=UPI0021D7F932|nr:hypothetical protein [Kitasatospora sp. DSM 101779]MCU7822350.1 hypothetical protein [Kitasatospora sp. DSM 101779]
MLLPPENAHFVTGPVPPLLLLGAAPVHTGLPALADGPDGAMPVCVGWTLVPSLVMCVVDGPGGAGCVIPTLTAPGDPEEAAHIDAWCAAVEEAGGAVVVSLDAMPEQVDWAEVFGGDTARGGFVPLAALA